MTKPCFSKYSDIENSNEKLKNGSEIEKEDESILCKKIRSLLFTISPFPVYAIIIGLALKNKCLNQHDPITLIQLIGCTATIEMFHLILFSPPKRYTSNPYEREEVVDFEHPEDVEIDDVEKSGFWRNLHCFVVLGALWAFPSLVAQAYRFMIPSGYFLVFLYSTLVICVYITFKFYKVYRNNTWMKGYSICTIKCSFILFTFSTISLLLSQPCCTSSNFMTFLGSFTLLSALFHLRFIYFFNNPPKWFCILTIKPIRAFLKNWYSWMILMNAAIWGSIFNLIAFLYNDGSCSIVFPYALLAFCVSVPVLMIVKIICNCCKSMK